MDGQSAASATPAAYGKDVLTRLPAMTNQNDLAALTPARWSPS